MFKPSPLHPNQYNWSFLAPAVFNLFSPIMYSDVQLLSSIESKFGCSSYADLSKFLITRDTNYKLCHGNAIPCIRVSLCIARCQSKLAVV